MWKVPSYDSGMWWNTNYNTTNRKANEHFEENPKKINYAQPRILLSIIFIHSTTTWHWTLPIADYNINNFILIKAVPNHWVVLTVWR